MHGFEDLAQRAMEGLVTGESLSVRVQAIVQAGIPLLEGRAQLEEGERGVPAAGPRLVDGRDSGPLYLFADRHELLGGPRRGEPQPLEDPVVIGIYPARVVVPDDQAVNSTVVRNRRQPLRLEALGPFLAGKVETVLAGIDLALEVPPGRLHEEDVGGLARVEHRLEGPEVDVGGVDREGDLDAGLLLEELGVLPDDVVNPAVRGHDRDLPRLRRLRAGILPGLAIRHSGDCEKAEKESRDATGADGGRGCHGSTIARVRRIRERRMSRALLASSVKAA